MKKSVVLILIVFCLFFVSCSDEKQRNDTAGSSDTTAQATQVADPTEKPSNEVELTDEVIVKTISQTFTETTMPKEEIPSFLSTLESLQKFTVVSVEATEEDNTTTVNLKVNAPDFKWVLDKIGDAEGMSKEELDMELASIISDAPLRSEDISVVFYQLDNGEWRPYVTDQLINACYGGVFEIQEDLLKGEK